MDIKKLLDEYENALRGNDTDAAEAILKKGIKDAVDESDDGALLRLYNETLAFYRNLGRMDEAYEMCEQIETLMEMMDLEGSIPYASGLVNIAITYKEGKKLEDALKYMNMAGDIYEMSLPADAPQRAGFYNNKAMLLMDMNNPGEAVKLLEKSIRIIERNNGKDEAYYRIKETINDINNNHTNGLLIARKFYEECFAPKLKEELPDYVDKVAVGLVGKGSDCFGFDDEQSRDHDWGPDLCIFVTGETYEKIGKDLEKIYDELPKEFMGYKHGAKVSESKRRGVFVIEEFYKSLLGVWPVTPADFENIEDGQFAQCVNGVVFTDPEGKFMEIRNALKRGYPFPILIKKISEAVMNFSRCAQYDYERTARRGDMIAAEMMLSDGLKSAMKLAHYLDGKYPPKDKWLYRSCMRLSIAPKLIPLLDSKDITGLGVLLADRLYETGFISNKDDYLEHHMPELTFKAKLSAEPLKKLANSTAKAELDTLSLVIGQEAYDEVVSDEYMKLRLSRFYVWDRVMLLQYIYDMASAMSDKANIIGKKYDMILFGIEGLEGKRKETVDKIMETMTAWFEDCRSRFPKCAAMFNKIYLHDLDDTFTDFETDMRCELCAYSEHMLDIYAQFTEAFKNSKVNAVEMFLNNMAVLNGFKNAEDMEND